MSTEDLQPSGDTAMPVVAQVSTAVSLRPGRPPELLWFGPDIGLQPADYPVSQRDHLAAMEALRHENERLKAEADYSTALMNRLSDLLSRTAIALRGPEPPMTRWSFHDLPERAEAAIAAIDVMHRAAMAAAGGASADRSAQVAEVMRLVGEYYFCNGETNSVASHRAAVEAAVRKLAGEA